MLTRDTQIDINDVKNRHVLTFEQWSGAKFNQLIYLNTESDKDITQICPNLFISNWNTSCNSVIIDQYNINVIVSVCEHEKVSCIQEIYKQKDIQHYNIKLYDHKSEKLNKLFYLLPIIHQHRLQNKNVLIHCMSGISRSASLVLLYLLYEKQLEYGKINREMYGEIMNDFKRKRKIQPNDGFILQLEKMAIEGVVI